MTKPAQVQTSQVQKNVQTRAEPKKDGIASLITSFNISESDKKSNYFVEELQGGFAKPGFLVLIKARAK